MISVLGAGSAGLGMVVHLSSMGVPIRLWNRSCSKLKIFESGSPAVSVGVIKGEFPVNQVTCDIRDVVDSDVIICTIPSHGHGEIFGSLSSYATELPPIILCSGRVLGGRIVKRILGESVQIIECETVMHTCRSGSERGHVELLAIKPFVRAFAHVKSMDELNLQGLPQDFLGRLKFTESDLDLAFGSAGMILHCIPMMLNTGWIESGCEFHFYREAISPSIASMMEQLDDELSEIASGYGIDRQSIHEWIHLTYGVAKSDLYSMLQAVDVYDNIVAPQSLHHRYVLEDVTCGLARVEKLAIASNQKCFIVTMLIDLACTLTNHDYREDAFNVIDLL